jgi:hypothetical protein
VAASVLEGFVSVWSENCCVAASLLLGWMSVKDRGKDTSSSE